MISSYLEEQKDDDKSWIEQIICERMKPDIPNMLYIAIH
jgi:hypothetical protein